MITISQELYDKNIKIINKCITEIPEDDYIIIASGPLSNKYLMKALCKKYKIDEYHFSDASSPIIDIKSVNIKNKNIKKIPEDLFAVFIPLQEFDFFCNELVRSYETVSAHNWDKSVFLKNANLLKGWR